MTNCSFENFSTSIFYFLSCNATFDKVFFKKNAYSISKKFGTPSNIFYENSRTTNLIKIENCKVMLENSLSFLFLSLFYLEVLSSVFLKEITSYSFENHSISQIETLVFNLENPLHTKVENCFFHNLSTNWTGAAFYLHFIESRFNLQNERIFSKFNLSSSFFEGITGNVSSCIYLLGYFQINLNKNIFLNNSALIGEAAIGCLNCKVKECGISLEDNIFAFNFANRFGALFMTLNKIIETSSNFYFGNNDGFNISNKYAAGDLKLNLMKLSYQGETFYDFDNAYVVSGTPFNMSFFIQTSLNSTLKFINTCKGYIKPEISFVMKGKPIKIVNGFGYTINGVLNFYNLTINYIPDNNLSFIITAYYTNLPYKLPDYQIDLEFNLKFRKCLPGKIKITFSYILIISLGYRNKEKIF